MKGQESYLQKEVVELEMKVMGLCYQQLPQLCLLVAALERKHASVNEVAPPKLNVLTARVCS